jgi:aminopeptidase C
VRRIVQECKEMTPKLQNTFSLQELEFKWNFETFEIKFEKSNYV